MVPVVLTRRLCLSTVTVFARQPGLVPQRNQCFFGSVRESGETCILRGFLKRTYFHSAGRPNDTFSPEWPINWGLAVEMTLRGRDDGRSAKTVLLALRAWKPAKDTGFHIPTAMATEAVKSNKLLNPRKSHDFPDSCAEPINLHTAV